MPDKRISELTHNNTLLLADNIPTESAGQTVRQTNQDLAQLYDTSYYKAHVTDVTKTSQLNTQHGRFRYFVGGLFVSGDPSVIICHNGTGIFRQFIGGDYMTHQGIGQYWNILGGEFNTVSGNYSTIVAGAKNQVRGIGAVIAGGTGNSLFSNFGLIGGGNSCGIYNGDFSFVGAGLNNKVGGPYSTIIAGQNNLVTGSYSTVGAGLGNAVYGNFSFAGAGFANYSYGNYSFLGAGNGHTQGGDYNVLIGGDTNAATGNNNVLIGGANQLLRSNYGILGGGNGNQVLSDYAVLMGGRAHYLSGYASILVGGWRSTLTGHFSFLGGGESLLITGAKNVIVGGFRNSILGSGNMIGAGEGNSITANFSYIGAGRNNYIKGIDNTIGGGRFNFIGDALTDQYNTVAGGGYNNAVKLGATVGGGERNVAWGNYATVVGGYSGLATGDYSTVLGGRECRASGLYSLAYGYNSAVAQGYSGAAVFGDSTNTPKYSKGADTFTFNYNKGVYVSGGTLTLQTVKGSPGYNVTTKQWEGPGTPGTLVPSGTRLYVSTGIDPDNVNQCLWGVLTTNPESNGTNTEVGGGGVFSNSAVFYTGWQGTGYYITDLYRNWQYIPNPQLTLSVIGSYLVTAVLQIGNPFKLADEYFANARCVGCAYLAAGNTHDGEDLDAFSATGKWDFHDSTTNQVTLQGRIDVLSAPKVVKVRAKISEAGSSDHTWFLSSGCSFSYIRVS